MEPYGLRIKLVNGVYSAVSHSKTVPKIYIYDYDNQITHKVVLSPPPKKPKSIKPLGELPGAARQRFIQKRIKECQSICPHTFAQKMKTSVMFAVELINNFDSWNKVAEEDHWQVVNGSHYHYLLRKAEHQQLARDIAGRP